MLHLRCLATIPITDNTAVEVNGHTQFRTGGSFPGNLSLSIHGSFQIVDPEAKTKKEPDGTESTHDTESEDTEMTSSAKRLIHRWVPVPKNRLSLPGTDFEKDLKNSKRIPKDSHSHNNSPECSLKAQELESKGEGASLETSNPRGEEELGEDPLKGPSIEGASFESKGEEGLGQDPSLKGEGASLYNPIGGEEGLCGPSLAPTLMNIKKDRLKAQVQELSNLIDKLMEDDDDKWRSIEDDVVTLLKKLEK